VRNYLQNALKRLGRKRGPRREPVPNSGPNGEEPPAERRPSGEELNLQVTHDEQMKQTTERREREQERAEEPPEHPT
jgi:hypothetical protein